MKKILCIMLVLACAAGLAGCLAPAPIDNDEGSEDLGIDNDKSSEDLGYTILSTCGFYYSSADIPDADIEQIAIWIVHHMMLPDENYNPQNYKATPDMIYSSWRLQAGILYCCFAMFDGVKSVYDGGPVDSDAMVLCAKRMFGVDISGFDRLEAPYYSAERGGYVGSGTGSVGGYYPDSIEVASKNSNDVHVRVLVCQDDYSDGLKKIDYGMKDLHFKIDNDDGVYYLRFEEVS